MFGDFICGNYGKNNVNNNFGYANQPFGSTYLNQPFDSTISYQGLGCKPLMSEIDQKFYSDWEDLILCYCLAETLF